MRKTFFTVLIFVMLGLLLLCFAGCKRSSSKMKKINIKTITRENVHGVITTDDKNIWITGNYGTIYHSSDGGVKWTKQESGIEKGILVDGVFLDNSVGWVVGLFGTVLHTNNGGITWIKQETPTTKHLFGVFFSDKKHGWAVGEWGTVICTDDGGVTWKKQREEIDRTFNNVTFADNQTGWIVGERGVILHTIDGGKNWIKQLPKLFEREDIEEELANPPPSLFSVVFKDKKRGWACGIDGIIIYTADGGNSWDLLLSGTDLTLYTIFLKDNKGWIVGDRGVYLMSFDGGMTWEVQEKAITSKQPFRDVNFTSSENGFVVGAGGTVIHTVDGGKTWEFLSGLSYTMEFFQMPEALEFKGMVTE